MTVHLGDPLGLDAVQTVLVLHGEADQEHVLGENVIIITVMTL